MKSLGGRKFTVAIVLSVMGFTALMFGKMNGSEFADMAGQVMLWFGAANAGSKFASKEENRD